LKPALAAAVFLLAAFMFLFAARDVLACGYCVEDKMAAVYDHAIVVRALDRRHEMAFFAIEGALAENSRLSLEIQNALESTRGVDRGSARVSLPAGALSFAYDPARQKLGPIVRALEKTLAPKGLSPSLLRVIN
jgi:hypothetical protein